MRGKIPVDELLFDPEISKTERKNKKKKKQKAKKVAGESSSFKSIITEEPTTTKTMADEENHVGNPNSVQRDQNGLSGVTSRNFYPEFNILFN